MKITITIQDTEDGQVEVKTTREPEPGETNDSVTQATALEEEMLAVVGEPEEARVLWRYADGTS